MNNLDPGSPSSYNTGNTNQELSVEDVARMQAGDISSSEALSGAENTGISTQNVATQNAATQNVATQSATAPIAPTPSPSPLPQPQPITIPKRPVSGRYRSSGGFWQLELRVDVDGKRPMKRVSGDFFQTTGGTTTYFGSWVINAPTVTFTTSTVTIEGISTGTYATGYPKARITIPRVSVLSPPASATIQFYSLTNVPGATYVCAFESAYFRTVQFEQDSVSDATQPIFTTYNTGALPSGGPARVLSIAGAYGEAGIQVQTAGVWNTVPVNDAGGNVSWSNSELHASMLVRFSLWKDDPQWKVWLLAAQKHDIGPGLYGIMFDQQGKQRQGCATFYQGIGGNTADKLRLQLYTSVHELGHCFNLLHSWQKSYAVPPVPNRPAALSWMNYPWNYPGGGEAGFWSAFPFQFDDQEVIHLRHAFRNNIIMGGNNFTVGAGLQDETAFADPIIDNSGLRLEIGARKSYTCGEPVVIDLRLHAATREGKKAHCYLHPNTGFVQVGIRKPGGQTVVYEPLIEQCVAPDVTILDDNRPTVEESAYIGYGKSGFYFDQAGNYQIRAVYYAIDGSQVLSNIITLRVRHPVTAAEEELADLFLGEDQGTLLYLLGSDSEYLSRGNEAFETVLEKHGKHPMAIYARLVKGINAGRSFKTITQGNEIKARDPQAEESVKLLSAVVDASEGEGGLDPISLDMTITHLAKVQRAAGDEKGATTTLKRSPRRAVRAAAGTDKR